MPEFSDEYWMQQALDLAEQGAHCGEVPGGAIVVNNNEVIGSGFNKSIGSCDASAHAEIVALREAGQTLNNYRLPECTVYVTLEPCTMCVGALIHARVKCLVFGTREPKAGAICSQSSLLSEPFYNHQITWREGVLVEQCARQLTMFFKRRRAEHN
jgi:tRNA(adenine34) deaminase